jgi:DNA-binding NarL/FixJ family response regulator
MMTCPSGTCFVGYWKNALAGRCAGRQPTATTQLPGPSTLHLIDLAMPIKNGVEAAREIFALSPLTPMLLLTVQEVSAELARVAREAGFRGAVTKGSGNELVTAVDTLLGKGTFFRIEGSLSASE